MLLQCPDCGTNYEVDDDLVQDSTVQLQCESCEVELVPAAPSAPMVQDEKTAMLAALDPEELERILGKRSSAPAVAAAAAPLRVRTLRHGAGAGRALVAPLRLQPNSWRPTLRRPRSRRGPRRLAAHRVLPRANKRPWRRSWRALRHCRRPPSGCRPRPKGAGSPPPTWAHCPTVPPHPDARAAGALARSMRTIRWPQSRAAARRVANRRQNPTSKSRKKSGARRP